VENLQELVGGGKTISISYHFNSKPHTFSQTLKNISKSKHNKK